jgi:hypothetical protein
VITTRHHEIQRVYVNDVAGRDLMLIGAVHMDLKNGKSIQGEFTARLVVHESYVGTENSRLAFSQVWADTAPFLAAMKD